MILKPHLRRRFLCAAIATACTSIAHAGLSQVRFVVVDPQTGHIIPGEITVTGYLRPTSRLLCITRPSDPVDVGGMENRFQLASTIIRIPAGTTIAFQQDRPVREITITVTASRLSPKKNESSAGTTRDKNEISKFVNTTGGDSKALTKGQTGVAEDSAGQQHVRGEHADIAYVVDGVPLPDTLSGRQGSVVVPSTIQSLDILTGGFAPEFGAQTAAILNITTLPGARRATNDLTLQGGNYNTGNGEYTALGPWGRRASYVVNIGATRTDAAIEPPQPDNQTSHNTGTSQSIFTNLRFRPSAKDSLTFTLSHNPDTLQIANRTGLPDSFASAGQGFGFLGLRNADGTRPDVDASNSGLLGAAPELLPSQQKARMDINQKELSEFATLNWQRRFNGKDTFQVAITGLHSQQEVSNGNPLVDVLNLPVDSSIEFNPTASRNVRHLQLSSSYAADRGAHKFKAGFVFDQQNGNESYQIIPASQLALDALAATAPNLAPPGSAGTDVDINGNPIYTATGPTPTLKVKRDGSYKAAYVQDTWQINSRFVINYGLRADWYQQSQNLGQANVDDFELSPRLNFSYRLNPITLVRWSYNHLFNTPPLAQGAVVGQAIQPEKLDQFDLGITRDLGKGQSLELAYYYKQIKNQVDTGLLIPGSEIGLYSAVNLEKGGVHGVEVTYNIAAPKGIGWDGYVNYAFSAAKPNGKDNTGEDVDEFNDHDQRHTLGAGLAYTWRNGATAALTYQYGSGLASSIVPPSLDRTPRSQFDLRLSTGDKLFRGHGGISLDIENLTDQRSVINFQSAFSGTRFQMARRFILSANFKF